MNCLCRRLLGFARVKLLRSRLSVKHGALGGGASGGGSQCDGLAHRRPFQLDRMGLGVGAEFYHYFWTSVDKIMDGWAGLGGVGSGVSLINRAFGWPYDVLGLGAGEFVAGDFCEKLS